MADFELAEQADLGLMYDITHALYEPDEWQRITRGFLTREVFVQACADFKVPSLGFCRRGEPIGGVMYDGDSVHIAVLPEFHGRWATLWPRTLAWVLRLKDPMPVAVDVRNAKCLRFLERNNFRRIKTGETHITFELSSQAPPHRMRHAVAG